MNMDMPGMEHKHDSLTHSYGITRRSSGAASLCNPICTQLHLFFAPVCSARPAQTAVSEQKTMTLDELQQMALRNNPTFAHSAANVSGEGRKKQSGLYPNPTVDTKASRFEAGRFTGVSKAFRSAGHRAEVESWA